MDGRKFVSIRWVRAGICGFILSCGICSLTSVSFGQSTTLPSGPSALSALVTPPTPETAAIGETAGKNTVTTDTAAPRQIEQQSIRAGTPVAATTQSGESHAAAATKLPSGITNAMQVAAALVAVVGLILIGKALARKFLPAAKVTSGKGVMEVLARYPISKNQSLVMVRIGSQIVTLNQGKEMSQSVLVISEPTEVANILGQIEGAKPSSIQAGFNKMLTNARMDLEKPENDPEREMNQEPDLRSMGSFALDEQLDEMASAKRQLMELRQQVRSVRDSLPRM